MDFFPYKWNFHNINIIFLYFSHSEKSAVDCINSSLSSTVFTSFALMPFIKSLANTVTASSLENTPLYNSYKPYTRYQRLPLPPAVL